MNDASGSVITLQCLDITAIPLYGSVISSSSKHPGAGVYWVRIVNHAAGSHIAPTSINIQDSILKRKKAGEPSPILCQKTQKVGG